MSIDAMRKELHSEVDSLNEDQLAALLTIVQSFKQIMQSDQYDPEKDTMIGMLVDDPDTASRVEEILHEQRDPRSGWTQKD